MGQPNVIRICPPDCAECADRKVPCFECNPTRHFKTIPGHIQVHKMSIEDYRKKYTQDGTGEDVPIGWSWATFNRNNDQQQPKSADTRDPLSGTLGNLSDTERAFFESRFALLFRQADQDPALESIVRDIVLSEINIARYQERQTVLSKRLSSRATPEDMTQLASLQKLIENAQATNLKLLDKLNLTREKKQAQKRVVESTPSRYVSAYERIRRNMSPETLKRVNEEEQEAIQRLTRKWPNLAAQAAAPDSE